ncbi:putative MFS monocarboxylate transporter [Trichoderma sp. SZMC 28012]
MAPEIYDGTKDRGATPPNTLPMTTDKQPTEELEFDTGIKAWLQVLGAFFLWFNSWGLINTFGVFQTFYEQYILSHHSPSAIAWIGSIQSHLLMSVGVITGPLFDLGYFPFLVPFGSFMVVLGYMMTSLSTKYYQIMLAQGLCVGIGTGCLFVPSVALLPQYFRQKRALANGIAATGASIGGVIYPIIFYKLQQSAGFPWATRALGFVCLATSSVSIAFMRVRVQPNTKRALLQLSAFKDPQYSLFCLAMFFGFLGFYNFLSFVQPWAFDQGIASENLSFYLLPILNAASTFGRVTPNFLADHVGPLNMLAPAAGITALLAYCWIAVNSTAGIIVLSIFYGFFSGGFVSLPPVVMTALTKDLRDLGTRLGMFFAVVSLALLVGTPIGGAILTGSNSYLGVQVFCGSCLAVCFIITCSIRLLRSGFTLRYRT